MISDEAIERVVEVLVDRIESANTYILEQIGNNIKKIKTVKPSDRYKLEQILKYGGDYDKIVEKIAEVTKMNVRDIKKIFEEVAKTDYKFAKKFYEYNGIKYIPWEENTALRNQVNALANITANEYLNFANTRAIGFNVKNAVGDIIFQNLDDTYIKVIDEAVWNIRQGTDTFDNQMRKIMKELGTSGVKYLDYESGHIRRLDSAVRMNIRGAITSLHNELQQQFGKEFNSDGVEISVHLTPAPDHAKVQGRQFSNEEFDNFQNDKQATTYDGIVFEPEYDGRDRRSIGEYNCYHYVFAIVLGISKQVYSNEELQSIIDRSVQTFNFDGKEYTIYEGTQLQRQIETEIRRQKDLQILGKAGDDMQLVDEAQQKITQLTRKYKELSNVSGLPTKMERLRVSGYKRIKVDNIKNSTNIKSLLMNKKVFEFNTYQDNLSLNDKSYEYNKVYTYEIKNGGKGDNVQVTVSKKGYVWNNALLSDNIKGKGEGTKIALDLNEQSIKETGEPLRSLPEYNIVGIKNHTDEGKGLWESLVKKGYAVKNKDNSYTMLKKYKNAINKN